MVITVLNAYSGFALVAEGLPLYCDQRFFVVNEHNLPGFMLDNPLLTTIGSLIGVSGSILSYIMVGTCRVKSLTGTDHVLEHQCVAMNRTLTNVLFGGIGSSATQSEYKMEGAITKTSVDETVDSLANAENVILVRISSLRSLER